MASSRRIWKERGGDKCDSPLLPREEAVDSHAYGQNHMWLMVDPVSDESRVPPSSEAVK